MLRCIGRIVSVEGVQEHFAGDVIQFVVELKETGTVTESEDVILTGLCNEKVLCWLDIAGGAKDYNKHVSPGMVLTMMDDKDESFSQTQSADGYVHAV